MTMKTDIEEAITALPTPATISNPYPVYDRLREASPVFGYKDFPPGTVPDQDEPVEAWVLVNYEDVANAARDHQTFSSRDPLQEGSSAPTLMLVNHDNPEHDQLRGIVNLAFSPKRIDQLEPNIRKMTATLLDEVGAGDVEVMDTMASVLPARVMVNLLGLPQELDDRFRRWATGFMLSADMTPEARQQSNEELAAYFIETVAGLDEKIKQGGAVPDSLITALLKADVDGQKLTLDEVIRFCITLVVAGSETTTFLLGNVLYNLATMPDMQARLRQDPAAIKPFIDETLRHSGPPQRLFRIATRDTELNGQQIREGDWVALFFGAANQDPSVFPEPRRFDIDRPNLNKHLTLGHGIHHCLGSALLKLEARILVEDILTRYRQIGLGAAFPMPQTVSLLNHGLTRLTLTLSPTRTETDQ